MSRNNPAEIHIIEPRPFVSRLHVLSSIVEGAARTGAQVYLHMADREPGVDLASFLDTCPDSVTIHRATTLPSPDPLGYSPRRLVLELAARGFRAARVRRRGSVLVVLAAVDDYPRVLPELSLRALFSGCRLVVVRYRVPDLVGAKGLKMLARRAYFAFFAMLSNSRLIIFDERVASTRKRAIVGDPWSGPFGGVDRLRARAELGWHPDVSTVLMVGYQDARKGFPFSAALLLRLADTKPDTHFRLVGKVDRAYGALLEQVKSALGDRFIHDDHYLTDAELASVMVASDLVLLPYSPSFTSSSGVLARASACGTPVLATNVGLVGWRVRRYSLGEVFEPEDLEGAEQRLIRLIRGFERRPEAIEFSANCSEQAVAEQFRQLLSCFDGRSV